MPLSQAVYEGAFPKTGRAKLVVLDEPPLLGATQFPLQVPANPYDFDVLYKELEVDYLVVLELLRFNIERHYNAAGKPASNPHAVSVVRLRLHDKESNEVLFDDYAVDGVIVGNDWDDPPYYLPLAAGLSQTLRASIRESTDNLLRVFSP